MIISHQYKFIFIKTHKTAGSSMEMARFSMGLAPDASLRQGENHDFRSSCSRTEPSAAAIFARAN